MSHDAIESITNKHAQRKRLDEKWQALWDYMDSNRDNPIVHSLAWLGAHLLQQNSKEFGQARQKNLQDYEIKEFVEAHKPSLAIIGLCVTQIFLSILSMGFSCAPSALGRTGESAKALHGISGGMQGLSQGSSSVSSILQTEEAGERSELQYLIERSKQLISEDQNDSQLVQQRSRALYEDEKQNEQKRTQTLTDIAKG
jgi:hypothetical protein